MERWGFGFGRGRAETRAWWLALGLVEFGVFRWGFYIYLGPSPAFLVLELSLVTEGWGGR